MSNPFHEYCPKCDAHHAAGDCTAWLRKQRTELRSALAASQEREGKMRDALYQVKDELTCCEEYCPETVRKGCVPNAYPCSACQARKVVEQALTLSKPSDAGSGGDTDELIRPLCGHCGKKPATCDGSYAFSNIRFSCDDCCNHKQIDGNCHPIKIQKEE